MQKLKKIAIAVLIGSAADGALCIWLDEPLFALLAGVGIGGCVTALLIMKHVVHLQERVAEVQNWQKVTSQNIAFFNREGKPEQPTIH
jgi:hypothetical protein